MITKRLFDNSLYDHATLQPSYWEGKVGNKRSELGQTLAKSVACDVAIIGGGYTGLSAAYHLAKDHHVSVCLLEAGEIGWGASGRNGGFCCMGGTMLGPDTLIRKHGLDEARRYYHAQQDAVELVRTLLTDEAIDAELQGDCELVVAEKPSHFAALEKECETFRDGFGLPCRMIGKEEFCETGYDAPHQQGAFAQAPGFGLDPLAYCLGLARAAQDAGAQLFPNSEVIDWTKQESKHVLSTKSGTITADHVIVACNGFMPEHLNSSLAGRALPLQSQIIVTRPLSQGELEAHGWKAQSPAVNSRNVYFYYRMLPDNRFLIGGRGDFKGKPEGAENTAKSLHASMVALFPEWRDVEIEYTWRGLVCFTSALRPAVGRLEDDPSVSFGFGYHGNGVNNATWIGKELASWLATGNDRSQTVPHHLPKVLHGTPRPFPLQSLRPLYAKAGVAWHRALDMIDR